MRQTQCLPEGGCAGVLNMVGRQDTIRALESPQEPQHRGRGYSHAAIVWMLNVPSKSMGCYWGVGMGLGRDGANRKEWAHSRDNGTSANALP